MNVAKAKPNRSLRRRSGRPTREQAEQLTAHIVDVATRLFLESSFETVSVDLIAETARISKQTFYARFASKEAVFAAVIRKGANELLVPAVVESARHGPIAANLIRIVFDILKRALTPAAVALERLVSSEAHQFPQLARAYRDNELHARGLIANVFANAMQDGQVRSMDPDFLAEQFQYALVHGPLRANILGGKVAKADEELRERIERAVGLFLDGCRAPAPRRG
jgi:TetR/AcrR family transcriptional regulator, mexJK operon transcriptional repressor